MPDENDAILDAIADSGVIDWGFDEGNEAEPASASTDNPAPDASEDGGDPASPEGSNETPTPQERTYTEAEIRQMLQQAQAAQQNQQAQAQLATELTRLMNSDEPEDKSKFVDFIKQATTQRQQQAQAYSQISDQYAATILARVAPDEFIQSLTPEQKARIDPDKFQSDADFYDALIDLRAEVKANQSLAAKDVEANKAAEEARANNSKGAQLRQPSLAAVAAEPSLGRESNDDLWAAAYEEMGLTN